MMMKLMRAQRKAFLESILVSPFLSFNCNPHVFSLEYHIAPERVHLYASLKFGFLNHIHASDDSINLYQHMVRMSPPPNEVAFAPFLIRVVNCCYSLAISLYHEMSASGFSVNGHMLYTLINCYCLVNKVDFGFSILGRFFKHGFVPNVCTFSTLLKGLFNEQKISQAQELFRKIIRGNLCVPNVTMCGGMIDGLFKVGNTTVALEFLRDMERTRVEQNVIVYCALIDGLCKDNRMDEAVSLLREMIGKGIAPNVVTCNCLIKGLSNIGKLDEAINLVKDMVDLGISPNIFTFNVLIDALCRKVMEDANGVLITMAQHGQNPDVCTYNALMDGCCLKGKTKKAREFFDTMVGSGLVPDLCSYGILIKVYFKRSEVDQAMHLFREVPRRGLIPYVGLYNTILQGLFRTGRTNCGMFLGLLRL
ncbi:OLC1v1036533C1 [Oldenlandia corymbosa var. corymbosa]|uniref:OLC1v1036533C1 n=1 Tax=Oldenlandia corymbosa var. corymbosa TaxID=529605 RepID=A0AAV1CXK4_OLDCO|nr:OLC1v1036533C1 [Oldenlandia corymbosa var. corymbosa]